METGFESVLEFESVRNHIPDIRIHIMSSCQRLHEISNIRGEGGVDGSPWV